MHLATSILHVDGLNAAYGRAQVLFDVSLSLKRGETVALMGRNGAGKSTTLKAIMGLVQAEARALSFLGHDIANLSTYRIARLGLGYVPEDRRIFTDLTVFENIEVGRKAERPEGGQAWTPERLFSIFPNLADMRGRQASQMSGGEQQMLSIARTLMGNPQAILLDEPTEGLAPVIVDEMVAALMRMKREGLAVLVSEQNAAFAAALADRVYIIAKGVVRHEGPMAELARDAALREAYLGL